MALPETISKRLRSRTGARARSPQLSRPGTDQLPPARCAAHADSGSTAACGSCMRAQQQRLQAHYAASVAAAQEWRAERASMASAFS